MEIYPFAPRLPHLGHYLEDILSSLTEVTEDGGMQYYQAMNLISNIGICSWQEMPYTANFRAWPTGEAWTEATLYRNADGGFQTITLSSEQGISNLKNWLSSANLATISVDATKFSTLTSDDYWTLDNYLHGQLNNAATIVGYDDNAAYVENGVLQHGIIHIYYLATTTIRE